MTLTFEHRGQTRTLVKNPKVAHALKHGKITEADARLKPWCLRLTVGDKERSFTLSVGDRQAIADAKDILNGRQQKPALFSQFIADKEARRGIKIEPLAREWVELGLPDAQGRPRAKSTVDGLMPFLTLALRWWADKRVNSITRQTMNEFAAWRRQNTTRSGQGDSTTDHELSVLSGLCSWGVSAGKLDTNPFGKRERYRRPEDIYKCHMSMSDDDQQFHAVLNWFWADPENHLRIIAGAWLCFSALTGLRPGEPGFIYRVPAMDRFPTNLEAVVNGVIYPMPDKTLRMKVKRLKGGQNPAVVVHPVLSNFLNVWTAWLNQHYPQTDPAVLTKLFQIDQGVLSNQLNRACHHLKMRQLKPHGFGRAYYVRVRRSQGQDDASIASELGQASNGELIRSVYGEPKDPVGGQLHDWLPADENGNPVAPAWTKLCVLPTLLDVSQARDTTADTSKVTQDRGWVWVGYKSRN